MHKISCHTCKLTRSITAAKTQSRNISRNTAIAQGLREGHNAQNTSRWVFRRKEDEHSLYKPKETGKFRRDAQARDENRTGEDSGMIPGKENSWSTSALGFSNKSTTPRSQSTLLMPLDRTREYNKDRRPDYNNERRRDYNDDRDDSYELRRSGPLPVPYTTSASEFIYGHSAVYAALNARRRKLYVLYLHPRSMARLQGISAASQETTIRRLAEMARVKIIDVGEDMLPLLDKMSGSRPHNGCVLEASPLPRPPVLSLGKATIVPGQQQSSTGGSSFAIATKAQNKEELEINGNPEFIPSKADRWRKPLVLLIDDILDPGNLGAIIRSAYFLGVDALAVCTRTCAPITPTALKASAGAAEALPILAIDDAISFLKDSSKAGWKIYCGTAPVSTQKYRRALPMDDENSNAEQPLQIRYTSHNGAVLPRGFAPVRAFPTVLVVGGEGKGLRPSLMQSAYAFVEILPKIEMSEVGVDSLNVSVSAALLVADLLRPRPKVEKKVLAEQLGKIPPKQGLEPAMYNGCDHPRAAFFAYVLKIKRQDLPRTNQVEI